MNPETDNLSPDAKSFWMKICNNAELGRICDLYGTSEVSSYEFDQAGKRLLSIADGLDSLISGKDTTFTAYEHLPFTKATNLFLIKHNAFNENAPTSICRPKDADAIQAQKYFREAIDAIQPIVAMGKIRLWPGTKGRTFEQDRVLDINENQGVRIK